jgi:hypothetical protein
MLHTHDSNVLSYDVIAGRNKGRLTTWLRLKYNPNTILHIVCHVVPEKRETSYLSVTLKLKAKEKKWLERGGNGKC